MTKIKEARLALGITAMEAARRIGISRQRYSQYERGIYEANYEMLLRMGEVFGVTVDWLLDRESAPAELRRSALVGRVMSLSDDQVRTLSALLDQLSASPPVPMSELHGQTGLPVVDLARPAVDLALAAGLRAGYAAADQARIADEVAAQEEELRTPQAKKKSD